uniref:Uncharacterized protein n=1 Tax=Oryza meridionalis TaxID=40149 RepID=A0A0E0D1Z4_9ORYZ
MGRTVESATRSKSAGDGERTAEVDLVAELGKERGDVNGHGGGDDAAVEVHHGGLVAPSPFPDPPTLTLCCCHILFLFFLPYLSFSPMETVMAAASEGVSRWGRRCGRGACCLASTKPPSIPMSPATLLLAACRLGENGNRRRPPFPQPHRPPFHRPARCPSTPNHRRLPCLSRPPERQSTEREEIEVSLRFKISNFVVRGIVRTAVYHEVIQAECQMSSGHLQAAGLQYTGVPTR